MKLSLTLISCMLAVLGAAKKKPSCEITKSVTLSFYGRGDASGSLAYSECGRTSAGGRGSFESPLTMAAAPGAFAKCEVIFVPYLLKYVRFEDLCASCVKDWAEGKRIMQIWTGNDLAGGQEQSDCEKSLAPTHGMAVIQNPGADYRLDTTPLYARGATSPCAMDHRYSLLNNEIFCYGRKDKTAGRRRKKPVVVEEQSVIEPEGEEDMLKLKKRTVDERPAVPRPRRPAIIL